MPRTIHVHAERRLLEGSAAISFLRGNCQISIHRLHAYLIAFKRMSNSTSHSSRVDSYELMTNLQELFSDPDYPSNPESVAPLLEEIDEDGEEYFEDTPPEFLDAIPPHTSCKLTVKWRTNDMEKGGRYSLNVIGAGGIGSWLMHALVRPARRFADANKAHLHIRIYDSDKVDESNVHHQNFTPTDVGMKKVDALFEQLSGFNGGNLTLEACPWDVRTEDDFQMADLTIVAIDSPDCRALVASSSKAGKWAICTCAGDSFCSSPKTQLIRQSRW